LSRERREYILVGLTAVSLLPTSLKNNVAHPKENAEKSLSWLFSARKSKSAVFDFLHFQSLTTIENAWPSLAVPGRPWPSLAVPGQPGKRIKSALP
jgi:hypothetical protein